MKVLVVESELGGADSVKSSLIAAGHVVLDCDTHEAHAPCRGLATVGLCPLDEQQVDVAVVHHTGPELSASERGALCAARRRVPVVVDGEFRRSVSFGPGTFVAGDDLVATCEDAARSGAAHSAAVRRELLCAGVLDADDVAGQQPPVSFDVARSPRRLRLTIRLPEGDPRRPNITKSAAEALRRFDPWASVIDVVVDTR